MTRTRPSFAAILAPVLLAWTACGGAPAPAPGTSPMPATPEPPAAAADRDQIDAWNQEAVDYIEQKSFAQAQTLLRKVLKADPDNVVALYNAACACALQGDKARAVDFLTRSVQAGWEDVQHMRNDPDLDSIRNEPGYKALLPD